MRLAAVLFMLAAVNGEHTESLSTALPPIEPYTYPVIRPATISARKIECQDDPDQAFIHGFTFLLGADNFEFTYGSVCQFSETGCWAPVVDHNTVTYNESYNKGTNAQIECTAGRSAGDDTEVWCLEGHWKYSMSGDVLTPDDCACTVSGYGITHGSCHQCTAGSYVTVTEEQNQCVLCTPGHYSSTNGSAECTDCQPGYYSNVSGAVRCEPCSSDHYAKDSASIECTECPRGSFTTEDGSAHCSVCPVGHTTYLNNPDSEQPCVGPKQGMKNNKDKVTDYFLTEIPDLGTFRDNVRVHFTSKGQWDLYNKIHYVDGKFHFSARKKPWFTTTTIESIKPLLRGVYCWVSGEQFSNNQLVHTVSGAECKSHQGTKAYCTNEGQLSKEPGCYTQSGSTHSWEVCDVPKCREEKQCPHMDSGVYGRIINVEKGLCWDGRGYPAISHGNNIGYNKCHEPVDKSSTDHSYQYIAQSGQIRSYRAKVVKNADLCLTLIPTSGAVVLKTCGDGEQAWNIERKGCLFKLVARYSDQCIGCYNNGKGASCDLHTLNCDSDYVWHKFLPIDDTSCTYTTMGQKPADTIYDSLRFDSKVAAKATCNQLGYKCSGYLFNSNNNDPSYSLLSGEMVALEGIEEYWSKSKDCDEATRVAAFEQTYNSKNGEKEINIDTNSGHINDP